MNKKLILVLSALAVFTTAPYALAVSGPFGYDLEKDINRNSRPQSDGPTSQQADKKNSAASSSSSSSSTVDLNEPISSDIIKVDYKLYPNPNLAHAKASYKNGNYTGCLQELFAFTHKNPHAEAYYYMAMAFSHLGDRDAAINAYERALISNPNEVLTEYATKGRDCLTGGPACITAPAFEEISDTDPLDAFINAPYGNGFSPELNSEIRKKELENIQDMINRKQKLSPADMERIKKFDSNTPPDSMSENITGEKLALADGAEPTNDDIVSALDTLKRAGMTVSIQPGAQNMNGYQNPQMAEMSMLLGNKNNNNNNEMWNMLPYMMQGNGQTSANPNVNPQVIQAMMMNSMLNNLDFNNSDNNR